MLKKENINKIKLKIVASLILISMFIQTLSPFNNISNAANIENLAPMDQYLVMVVDNSEDAQYDYEDYGIAHISLVLRGNLNFSGFDVAFKYDSSVMQPTYNAGTKRKPDYQVATTMDDWDPTISAWGSSISENNTWLFPSENKFRIEGTTAVDKNPSVLGEDVVIADMYFLLEDGYDLTNIPSTVLVPQAGNGLETGIALVYDTYYLLTNVGYYGTEGTAQAEKEVDTISVKNNPTKTNYEHGETIDLTGGVITVNYTDGTSENIDMTDSKVGITTGNTADVNTNYVGISYNGKQTSFNITVTDPVDTLIVNKPMTKTEYSHGETLDFSGLELKATKRSGATQILTSSSSDISISENTADINSSNFTAFPDDGTGITKGTQKITFSYKGKSVDGTIVVNDTVDSVELTDQPTKQVYKYGESLDLTGAKLKINFGSGNTSIINLPDGNAVVSAYSSTTIGTKQNLTVTYGGKTAVKTIDVEVYNYIDSASITPPNKVEYSYNTDLDITGASMQLIWKNSNVTSVAITDSMISGYNKTTEGKQTITVTYNVEYILSDGNKVSDTIIKTFKVDVVNNISKIDITAPTKTKYNHGDSLDLTGGIIKITYENGAEETRTMTTAMITESNGSTVNMSPTTYDNTNKVSKTLKIEYTEGGKSQSINYPIEIINTLKYISINGTPKTSYNVNESMETGLSIIVNRELGSAETITVTSDMVTGFDTTTEGSKTAIISYTENGVTKTTNLNYTVADSVTGITLKTKPSKTEYKYQEPLDITGGKITVSKGSGTQDIEVTEGMVSGYDKTTLGKQTITITYGGQTVTYEVTVKDYVTGIIVTPSVVTGKYNDELSKLINDNNITYVVTYAKAGARTPVVLTESMVTGYSKTSVAEQNLTITYTDNDIDSATNGQIFTAPLKITLNNATISISMKQQPSKTEYGYGDTIDLSGGKITVTKENGDTEEKVLTDSGVTVTEIDGSSIDLSKVTFGDDNTTTKNLKVTYDGKETSFTIKVINKVTKTNMHTTPKTNYNVNDTLDLTTDGTTPGEILVTRQTGVAEVVKLTDSRVNVTGFDSSVEHTNLPLTVTFTENGVNQKATYNVDVKDTVTSVTLKVVPNKTEYKYNEELDVTGGKIEITKGSGTTTINLDSSMVSGYDKTTLGERTLTITYGGQTTTYKVNVKDYVIGISVNPTSVTGKYNDKVSKLISDNNITYTVTYAKGGAQSPSALAENMITGYDKTETSKQSLTITYKDQDTNSYTNGQSFTATLDVTLLNKITGITITAPTTNKYNHGDSLNLAGGEIELTYADGTTRTEPITSDKITEVDGSTLNMSPNASEYGADYTLSKTLKIEYTKDGITGTVNYPITIVNDVKSIDIHTTPTKVSYNVNETLDVTDGEIKVTRATGTPEIIPMTNQMVTNFDSTKENTALKLNVEYTENGVTKTTDYTVSVKDSVKKITLNTTPKTDYKYNDEIDVSTGVITVESGSGTKDIQVTESMITGYDKTQLGEQEITITYGGQTVTYKVTVKDYVTGITVTPNTVTGKYNDELSKLINDNNITYTVTYAKAGAKTPVVLAESMVAGYNKTNIAEQNLTVTYTDNDVDSATNGQSFTATLDVTLLNKITGITITAPTTNKYNHGDSLNLAGGEIELTYADGTTRTEPITSDKITEVDGSTLNMSPNASEYGADYTLSKTLKIEYTKDGITGTVNYPITIVNDVKSIDIHTTPTKVSYNVNETLDVTDGEIKVTRATGTPEIIPMTNQMVTNFDSTKENTALKLNVEYTENGVTKTTDYTVSVKDSVKKITLNTTPKTDYKYNDEIDVSTGVITVESGSGTKDIQVTESMITGYDKTQLGEQEITITYGGQTVTYKVTVKDYVTGITVTPNTVTGKYNDELSKLINDNNITYTVTYAKAGAKTPVVLAESMVAGYNKTNIAEQNLTVTYTDNDVDSATNGQAFTATLKITLNDNIESMEILSTPKQNYKYGEPLDITGGTIEVVKSSGTQIIPITESMVKELDGSEFDSTKLGTRNLNVTYGGITKTYEVTVSDYVVGIILTPPTKTKYQYGESLDLTEGTVQKIMASNAVTTAVALTDSSVNVSAFNPNQIGTQVINVTYEGFTKNFGVIVEDSIQSIEIKTKPKVSYKYGEELDVTGGEINVIRSSGVTTVAITKSMVSGYNPEILGNQELTVTYEGKQAKYTVNVQDYIKDIVIVKPNKLIYKLNEIKDLTGGQVQAIMASGTATSPVAMTDSQVVVTGYNTTSVGVKTITVQYKEFIKTFDITVEDNLSGMIIKTLPTKLDYKYGESLDLTGGTIEVTKESGAKEIINMTSSMVSGYNSKTIGNQILTVTYEGITKQFSVNVKDYITKLKVIPPTKTKYEYGEDIDLTGGKVSLVTASGKIEETVDLTAAMISGFESKKEGTQNINVSYKGFNSSFNVNVKDTIKAISMASMPNKTSYKYGEDIDVTGATIYVVKTSGIYTINVTKDMISGYSPNTSGNQSITVTYAGLKTNFIVYVEKKVVSEDTNNPETSVIPTKTTKNANKVTTNPQVVENIDNTQEDVKDINSKTEETPKQPSNKDTEEKPTITLGVKDEKTDETKTDNIDIIIPIGILGLLIILLVLAFKHNVRIYEEEDGEFLLCGLDRISKKNLKLNIDKYLDNETKDNKVKIVLNKSITKKLKDKELEITHKENIIKYIIKAKEKKEEIILK